MSKYSHLLTDNWNALLREHVCVPFSINSGDRNMFIFLKVILHSYLTDEDFKECITIPFSVFEKSLTKYHLKRCASILSGKGILSISGKCCIITRGSFTDAISRFVTDALVISDVVEEQKLIDLKIALDKRTSYMLEEEFAFADWHYIFCIDRLERGELGEDQCQVIDSALAHDQSAISEVVDEPLYLPFRFNKNTPFDVLKKASDICKKMQSGEHWSSIRGAKIWDQFSDVVSIRVGFRYRLLCFRTKDNCIPRLLLTREQQNVAPRKLVRSIRL